jgi:hypothetical protein
MFLGSQLLNENEVLMLNYSMTYTLSCVARNSRPNVNINIIDGTNNMSIEKYPSVSGVFRSNQCDSSSFCTSVMYFTVTLNDTIYLTLKSLICQAENTTEPYVYIHQLK